ncbi:MAG: hypothetical protein NC517_07420 [Firmicutes bacterium]|nr:hypothetical protein [Bacillota bacterium]
MQKRITCALLLIVLSLWPAACSGDSSEEGILSPEEMEAAHLEMELTEGVLVDAGITPYSRYENGLSAYYVSMKSQEENLVTEEEFIASPVIYGYSVEEFARLLAEQGGFSPEYTWEVRLIPGEALGHLVMQDQAGIERTLYCSWRRDEAGCVEVTPTSLIYNYEWDCFDSNAAGALMYMTEPDKSELTFASSGELEVQAEKILKQLTGEEYYPEVLCSPMGETNRQKMRDRGGSILDEVSDNASYQKEDYYGFSFYRDVDGFPLMYLTGSLVLTEAVAWDEELDVQVHGNHIIPGIAQADFVSWGEGSGLRCLDITRELCMQEVYRERESVCDINRILENAKQYFDSILLPAAVTVNRIEIAYSYWFSDAEDGPLRNIAAPFWVVQYWDPASEMQMVLVFDAFSGQLLFSEMNYQP